MVTDCCGRCHAVTVTASQSRHSHVTPRDKRQQARTKMLVAVFYTNYKNENTYYAPLTIRIMHFGFRQHIEVRIRVMNDKSTFEILIQYLQ